MLLHRGALSFAFYPETVPPCIACGCSHSDERGSVYLLSRFQCGIGLTRESRQALPYVKSGRGNLSDTCIYFSTGLFASQAGRKWLLEFNQPAASRGRRRGGPRRPSGGGSSSGRVSSLIASPHPPSQAGTSESPRWAAEKGRLRITHCSEEAFSIHREGAAPRCPGSRQGLFRCHSF